MTSRKFKAGDYVHPPNSSWVGKFIKYTNSKGPEDCEVEWFIIPKIWQHAKEQFRNYESKNLTLATEYTQLKNKQKIKDFLNE